MSERLPTVSAAQGRALDGAWSDGTVLATDLTLGVLVRLGLVSSPRYVYSGKGKARGTITELGRAVVARRAEIRKTS